MAITVGEVNATLSLKDEMTAKITAAANAFAQQMGTVQAASASASAEVSRLTKAWGEAQDAATKNEIATQLGEAMVGSKALSAELQNLKQELDRTLDTASGEKGSAVARFFSDLKPKATEAGAAVSEMSTKLTSMLESPMGAMKQFGTAMLTDVVGSITEMGLGVAAGLVAIPLLGAALVKLGLDAKEAGSELNDLADKTGLSVPALDHLGHAVEVAGGTLSQATNALTMFEQRMAAGSDQFVQGLGRMGLSVQDFQNTNPDKWLGLIADGMSKIEDPTKRAAVAAEIGGRSFKEMIPVLMNLRKAEEMTADIQPWTEEQAKAANDFEMEIKSLVIHLENYAMVIGRFVLPAMKALFELFTDIVIPAAAWTLNLVGVTPILHGVANAYDVLTTAIRMFRGVSDDLPKVTGPAADALKRQQEAAEAGAKAGGALTLSAYEQKRIENELTDQVRESIKVHKEQEAAAKRLAAEQDKLNKKISEFREPVRDSIFLFEDLAKAGKVEGEGTKEWTKEHEKLAEALRNVEQPTLDTVIAMEKLEHVGTKVAVSMKDVKDYTENSKAALQEIADKAQAVYARMTEHSGDFTKATIEHFRKLAEEAQRKADGVEDSWGDALKKLSKDFATLAQVSGDSFGGVVQDVAKVVAALQLGRDAAQAWKDADTTTGKAVAAVGMATAIASATQGGGARGALGGAAAGAEMGTAIAGPWGAAVGAAVGFVVGLLRTDHVKRDFARAGHELGMDFSDGLITQLKKDKEKYGGEVAAIAVNLSNIIGEAGGLTDQNLSMFMGKLHDVFSNIEQGVLKTADATKILDQNWAAFVAAATDGDGRISDSLRVIIGLNEQFGTQSKEIAKWQQGQALAAVDGFNLVAAATGKAIDRYDEVKKTVDDTKKALDDLTKKGAPSVTPPTTNSDELRKLNDNLQIAQGHVDDVKKSYDALAKRGTATKDQLEAALAKVDKAQVAAADSAHKLSNAVGGDADALADYNRRVAEAEGKYNEALKEQAQAAEGAKQELSDLGIQAIASFTAAEATGLSFAQALEKIHPGLQLIAKSYQDLGLKIEDAGLNALIMQDNILTAAPELVKGIGGLNGQMIALDNLGLLNKGTFEAMERTGMTMYTRLQGEVAKFGGTTKDALLPMQPFLHAAADEAEKLGIEIDANTKMLIDQSKELGVWKDKGKTANDLMLDGMQKLVDKVGDLIDALNGIPNIKRKVTVDTPDPSSFPSGGDAPDYGGAQAAGGDYMVSKPTLFLAGDNGPERATFTPAGMDRDYGGGGGGSVIVNLTVQVPQGTNVNDPYAFAQAMRDSLRDDRALVRTAIVRIAQQAADEAA